MTKEQILKRIEELIELCSQTKEQRPEPELVFNGALTLLEGVYGPKSLQVRTLLNRQSKIEQDEKTHRGRSYMTAMAVLENLRQEIEAGLLVSIERRVTSDVLSDLIQLAREALKEPGERGKNVAAVLAAAAFEDTIRRIAKEHAGVVGQDKLADVMTQLKEAGLLVAPQLGIAQSYLNFRNLALHANWDSIERAAVEGVLAFVQELLLKHFES